MRWPRRRPSHRPRSSTRAHSTSHPPHPRSRRASTARSRTRATPPLWPRSSAGFRAARPRAVMHARSQDAGHLDERERVILARAGGITFGHGPVLRAPRRVAPPGLRGRGRWRQWHFFAFFQAQAALTGMLATAFVVPFVTHRQSARCAGSARRSRSSASRARQSPTRSSRASSAAPRRLRCRLVGVRAAPELLLRVAVLGRACDVWVGVRRVGTDRDRATGDHHWDRSWVSRAFPRRRLRRFDRRAMRIASTSSV